MASVKAKVKERTHKRFACWPLEEVVANLNPVLRGWGNYFRVGNSSRKFGAPWDWWRPVRLVPAFSPLMFSTD
jgi:hypothetical protein